MKARNRHIDFAGIPVIIQSGRGQKHEGHRVAYPYGYIAGTNRRGADNMAVDVFIGPYRNSKSAFIIDAVDDHGRFKQVKTFLGFPTAAAAERAFQQTYHRDPDHHIGGITQMDLTTFRSWLNAGGGKHPVHPDVAMASGGGVDEVDGQPDDDAAHDTEFARVVADHSGPIDWESEAERALQLASGGAVENFDHGHELFANSLRELGLMPRSSSAY